MTDIEFTKLMIHGIEVFEDPKKLIRWLNWKSPALGGRTVIDCTYEEIDDELGKIEHGILA